MPTVCLAVKVNGVIGEELRQSDNWGQSIQMRVLGAGSQMQ